MERLVCGFHFPDRGSDSTLFDPTDRKGTAPGERRVPFLSDPGRNGRLCPRDPFMDGIAEVHLPISDLQRHQLSGSGGSVYLPEEGYDTGIQKEIKDVKETTGSGKKYCEAG